MSGGVSFGTQSAISKKQCGQALQEQLKAGASLADYTGILGTQKDKVFRCLCTLHILAFKDPSHSKKANKQNHQNPTNQPKTKLNKHPN